MLSMAATLVALPTIGFSKTARSRPGHREAVRDVVGDRALAIGRGRLADDRAEGPAERPEAREADVEADVGDAAIGLHEQEHRALDPPTLQVAVRRLAESGPEGADEVRLGHVGDARESADVERPRIAAVHGVAGAQQPAVGVFGGPAHRVRRSYPAPGVG